MHILLLGGFVRSQHFILYTRPKMVDHLKFLGEFFHIETNYDFFLPVNFVGANQMELFSMHMKIRIICDNI